MIINLWMLIKKIIMEKLEEGLINNKEKIYSSINEIKEEFNNYDVRFHYPERGLFSLLIMMQSGLICVSSFGLFLSTGYIKQLNFSILTLIIFISSSYISFKNNYKVYDKDVKIKDITIRLESTKEFYGWYK